MGRHRGWQYGAAAQAEAAPSLYRVCVRLVPAVQDPHLSTFLQKLRVDWPTSSERASSEILRNLVLSKLPTAHNQETLPPGVLGSLGLKELVEQQGYRAGYDPNLDKCLGGTWG